MENSKIYNSMAWQSARGMGDAALKCSAKVFMVFRRVPSGASPLRCVPVMSGSASVTVTTFPLRPAREFLSPCRSLFPTHRLSNTVQPAAAQQHTAESKPIHLSMTVYLLPTALISRTLFLLFGVCFFCFIESSVISWESHQFFRQYNYCYLLHVYFYRAARIAFSLYGSEF